MCIEMGLVVEDINGNYVLEKSIMHLWNMNIFLLFRELNVFKMLDSIVGGKAKQAVGYKSFGFKISCKLLGKITAILGHSLVICQLDLFGFPIGVAHRQHLILELDIRNGIKTDIGHTVIVDSIVRAFQKNTVWEIVSDFQIHIDRRHGIDEQFAMMCL